MSRGLVLAAAAAVLLATAPAEAATTFNIGGTLGDGPGAGTNQGLSAALTLSLYEKVGSNWTFDYTLQNTSGAGVNTARVTIFGFNVVNTFTGAAVDSGDFGIRVLNGQTAQSQGVLDVCFKASGNPNNCSAGSGGLVKGASTSGRFTVSGVVGDVLDLNKIYVRYQGIDPSAFGGVQDNSGVGVLDDDVYSFGAVPEPATWAMMIGGFGLVGGVLRRRRALAAA